METLLSGLDNLNFPIGRLGAVSPDEFVFSHVRGNRRHAKCAAFLDMGTNSIRMMIVRIKPDQSYSILSRQKETIRLGEGGFESGLIREDAVKRAVDVCISFAGMARSYGVEETIAVGTSALRDALNGRQVIDRIKDESGIDIRIISGNEESRLIYLGVSGDFKMEGMSLFIDIGGGSTELAVGDGSAPLYLNSLDLGAIRLASAIRASKDGKVGDKQYERLRARILNACKPAIREITEFKPGTCYGSSGTIQNLAQIAFRMFGESREEDDQSLRLKDLRKVIFKLCGMTLKQRMSVPGLNPERADIIIPGAAILETIMSEAGMEKIHISKRELRDGLLAEHLGTAANRKFDGSGSRMKSILMLGRNCGFDELHAMRVLKIATSLFDSASVAGLHGQGDDDRELFGYAAILHDIGMMLSYENHHMNSYYFIKNADLMGFSRKEISIIAADAFFHGKLSPSNKYMGFLELNDDQMEIVTIHSAFLKIAEALDRSHAGYVHNTALRTYSDRDVILEIISPYQCTLELSGLSSHLKTFERAFGKKLNPLLVSNNT